MFRLTIAIFIALTPLLSRARSLSRDTIYYRVEKFGVRGDGKTDALPALTRLFQKACAQKRPVKVEFAPGKVYRIAQHLEDCNGRILISRASHMVVEGNGSTLLVHPSSRAFALYRSRNIVLRNFKIDYSPLPYTQGRITKADAANYYLEFKVDSGYAPPVVGDESYYKGGKMVDCIFANGDNRKFYQGHSWVKKVESLGNGTYGVKYALRKQEQLKTGDFFCMKIDFPASKAPSKQNHNRPCRKRRVCLHQHSQHRRAAMRQRGDRKRYILCRAAYDSGNEGLRPPHNTQPFDRSPRQ